LLRRINEVRKRKQLAQAAVEIRDAEAADRPRPQDSEGALVALDKAG
jgi:hypothetical protein